LGLISRPCRIDHRAILAARVRRFFAEITAVELGCISTVARFVVHIGLAIVGVLEILKFRAECCEVFESVPVQCQQKVSGRVIALRVWAVSDYIGSGDDVCEQTFGVSETLRSHRTPSLSGGAAFLRRDAAAPEVFNPVG
jgi:hypothetical protein